MFKIRLLLTAAVLVALGTHPAQAATDEQLEQLKAQIQAEIGAVKKDYEGRINTLEKRINTLETENTQLKKQGGAGPKAAGEDLAAVKQRLSRLESVASKAKTEMPAVTEREAANTAAIEEIERKLRASATETREIYHDEAGAPFDLAKLYDLPRPFEFHGYLRSGYGMNGEGGKMEAFKAPGAFAKYRLGNEAETYGEMELTNNWLREGDPLSAPYVRTTVMMSYVTGENFTYDSLNNQKQGNDYALRQAFIEGGNIFQAIPDIRMWAGQRYYQRMDIHINDFYYLDMSGYGAGIQDVPVGSFAKLSVAWLGGSVDDYQTDHGRVAKQNLDLRLTDIKVPLGKLTFWFDFSNTRGGEVRNVFNSDGSNLDIQSSSGWAIGVFHRTGETAFLGGYNQLSLQYGEGAAYNFASTLDSSGPFLDDAWHFRATDHFTIQPSPHFAVQAVGVYDKIHYGGPDSDNRWVSVGARPVYFFNDRFSMALEAGVDWVKSDPLGRDGHLWKVTFAPIQISRGQKFFSRPQLRAYVTYAGWSNDFKGLVGGTPYENDTRGLSYGIQAEAWW